MCNNSQQTRHVETMIFLKLGQRRRRWANIKTSLFQRAMVAENRRDVLTEEYINP